MKNKIILLMSSIILFQGCSLSLTGRSENVYEPTNSDGVSSDFSLSQDDTTAADAQQLSAFTPVVLSGDEYLITTDTSVQIMQGDDLVFEQEATDALSSFVYVDESLLIWTERFQDEEDYYRVQQLSLETGEIETLYWSKLPIYGLDHSTQMHFVSFKEDGALYILQRVTGRILRIAEGVHEYTWSPSGLGLVYTTDDATIFVTVDSSGSIASSYSMAEQAYGGVVFQNAKTVIGVESGRYGDAMVFTNLRTEEVDQSIDWPEAFTDEFKDTVSQRNIQIFPSPSEQYIVLQEFRPGELTADMYLYSRDAESTELFDTAVRVIGWSSEGQLLYMRKNTETEFYDLYAKKSILDDEILLVSGIQESSIISLGI